MANEDRVVVIPMKDWYAYVDHVQEDLFARFTAGIITRQQLFDEYRPLYNLTQAVKFDVPRKESQ